MRRTLFIVGLIAGCVGCDQGTKRMAEHALKDRAPVTYLSGCVQFFYAENTGAFGSLGANWPAALKLFAFVILPLAILVSVAVSAIRARSLQWPKVVAYGLIVGGGLGNILDRVADGYVVDFIYLHIGHIGTNVFNVADLAVMAGVVLLLVDRLARCPGDRANTQRRCRWDWRHSSC